jgi:DNA-binding CsgD family transcriptional regulator
MAARSTGDLYRCIDLTKRLLDATASGPWPVALRLLAVAGQLARDERALRLSLDIALGAQQKNPGFAILIDEVQHRLALLDGQPGTVNPSLTAAEASWPTTSAALWLAGREAVDAEASIAAVAGVRALARDSPHGQAVLAAVTAAATADDDAWQTALQLALQHDLRLIAADALEGLAVNAARAESCAECLRLLAAADRLRDETGYEWRFGFETRAIEAARNAALDAHGNAASAAITEGAAMDWREAAAYVRRARGERKRPRHGWASLTPTEQQVVNLVADGLTNPQIAGRLYISRTTVKTHIEHVFTKLGVRTRTELAAEAVRRRNS